MTDIRVAAFYPAEAPVPDPLAFGDVVIRRLQPSDAPAQYQAICENRERIDASQRQPIDATFEAHQTTLYAIIADHQRRDCFGFGIWQGDACVGSLTLLPLVWWYSLWGKESIRNAAPDYEACVNFWLASDSLEQHALPHLISWFNTKWAFSRVCYEATSHQPQRLALLETLGLAQVMQVKHAQKSVHAHYLFA